MFTVEGEKERGIRFSFPLEGKTYKIVMNVMEPTLLILAPKNT